MGALVEVDRREHWASVTLNRPDRRNALSIALRDELSDALDELGDDPDIKAVAIEGAGDVYCAGFDLQEFERAAGDAPFAETLWASSDRYHRAVATFPLPTVAVVNGPAVGGGFDLAVMCDLRIACTTARFAHPERAFGDVVYGPLWDLVGGSLARQLTMGGRVLSADEALAVNLVSEVVAPEALPAAKEACLEEVCVAPRDVLVRLKAKALRRSGLERQAATLDL